MGANIGLCFPRSTVATRVARRPSTWSSASMTYQARSMLSELLCAHDSLDSGYIGLDGPGFKQFSQTRKARNSTRVYGDTSMVSSVCRSVFSGLCSANLKQSAGIALLGTAAPAPEAAQSLNSVRR